MNNQFNSRGFKPSLGGDYPYYIESRKDKWYNSFDNAIKDIEEKDRYVDLVSIAEIVCKSYVFSNRTLIQNITRLPWMAKGHPNDNFIYHEIPNHGFEIDTYQNIAKNLKRLLLSELIDFVSNKKKIIILLSGGMDSRICASLLHELQVQNEYNGDVIAATWGLENSRDVVYAKKYRNCLIGSFTISH